MSKCADPILCYNNKYRHYSLATPQFRLLAKLVFDCGKCIFCRKKKSSELAARCVLHASLYDKNCFLTLTYDEKKPGYHNNFEYSDIQKFKKRLRAYCSRYHGGKKIEIFNVHEYGKNGKKHWHLVVFNHDFSDRIIHSTKNGIPLFTSKTLSRLWPCGFNTVGSVTEASALYQAQYTQKDVKNGNSNNARKSHSKHAGIGKAYFLQHYDQILRLGYVPVVGKKLPIPRYFLRLAHKHFCHFYEPSAFFPNRERARLYTPFKQGQENRNIADLFILHRLARKEKIDERSLQWDEFINENAFSKTKPDFRLAAENYLHDLNNKTSKDF